MRILVTGAGGFVGNYIARYLQAKGYEVVGTLHRFQECSFPSVVCNLAKAIENINGNFDAIVHAAGRKPVRKGVERVFEPQQFLDFKYSNVDSMEHIVDIARRQGIPRIIYLSTIGIYGEMRTPLVTEESDRVNLDAYGLTKYMAECILADASDIKSISLRMPGILGPGSTGVWMTNTIERFRMGESVTIYSPDFQTKNFVWVKDLAQFVEKLIHMDEYPHSAINLACHESASVREIVTEIKKFTASASEIIVDNKVNNPFCLSEDRAYQMGYESISPLEIVRRMVARK